MSNDTMPIHNKTKREAWAFYQKWRQEKTYSPALKREVRVSLKGWRHISGATGNKKRTGADVARRLRLLPYAKEIINSSTTIQNVTTKRGQTYYAIEAVVNIDLGHMKELRKVRVILTESQNGEIIFYSVMGKKIIR